MSHLTIAQRPRGLRMPRLAERVANPLRRSGTLTAGVTLLAVLLLLSVVVALALPDPKTQHLIDAYAAPGTSGHPLGADGLGRDVLAWIGTGIRTSLLVGLAVAAIAATVGTVIGLVAGYWGGALDALLMRAVDLQLAVPPLLLFIAASAVLAANVVTLVLLIAVVGWVPYARLVRARVLSERGRAFIAAARLAGRSRAYILFRHLLPAASTSVVVIFSLQVGYVILWESALSFVGLGLQPPNISLGFMIASGRDELATAWWIATMPGLAIVLLVLAMNLIGDGLRDVFKFDTDVDARG
ncbi:MAG TPA: ABC transporter permease [Conexibacter sp.]|jgi:peptide/nickel transport system permease protein|nr:ABC transporter permease [Conexibacter sp.]